LGLGLEVVSINSDVLTVYIHIINSKAELKLIC
jgi:hypothetical protein